MGTGVKTGIGIGQSSSVGILNEQTQDKILRLLFDCVNINFHQFVSQSLSLMTIVAICFFFKFDAKVIHFCEICKKKLHKNHTINVNMFLSQIIHKLHIHKPPKILFTRIRLISTAGQSRVVALLRKSSIADIEHSYNKPYISYVFKIHNCLNISIYGYYLKSSFNTLCNIRHNSRFQQNLLLVFVLNCLF